MMAVTVLYYWIVKSTLASMTRDQLIKSQSSFNFDRWQDRKGQAMAH